ncbi:hypothetical protein D3C78_844070 [compost metagenome]
MVNIAALYPADAPRAADEPAPSATLLDIALLTEAALPMARLLVAPPLTVAALPRASELLALAAAAEPNAAELLPSTLLL